MRSFWLVKNNNKKLILFFNGWSMDENHVKFLKSDNYDVLTFCNYQDLTIEEQLISEINNYSERILIGWSMGIWAAGQVADLFDKIKYSIAINGTLFPIDDNYGIAEPIYQATLDNFSETNREKFYRRMFISFDDFNKFLLNKPERECEDQKEELVAIRKMALENKNNEFTYDSAIISTRDKIIPTVNQHNFWKENAIPVEAGHYPFYLWSSWDQIVDYVRTNR